jgi:class 3 adenylate cyclase/tetratricopeptide (TPR) repeat protein
MSSWTCPACQGANPEGTRFCGHCGAPYEPEVSEEHLRGVVSGRIGDRLAEGGGVLPYERRLISALFADVSGFTTLADRLDPEELLEVIDPVIAGLSSVVVTYEGYIEKFAGDALLALFGAPVAHEDDAERALSAALAMHTELARLVQDLPHDAELTLHVGVNSGHGIGRILGSEARTDYAVLGDSVILAQRLESAAPPGETYVSQLTYELTRHRFEFEPVGELTLKGKKAPVFAWRLLGERSDPQPRGRAATAGLVGRDDELAALSTVVDGVVSGGDPGIGKSRLSEEAIGRARAQGVRWLETRCLSYGSALPYWPYAELVRRTLAEDDIDAHPYFARLLGLATPDADVAQLEPEEFRRRLHGAFVEWLTELAAEQPTIVSIEDVHWADSSSLELTRELVEVARGSRLVLYLIARPEAAETLQEVAPDAVRIELGALGDEQVESLIETLLDGSAPRGLTRIVQRHTAGNPFFVQEVIRSLQETGDLSRHESVWRLKPGWEPQHLPPTLEGVLAARIDLLPLAVADALHTASVIGRRLQLPLLEAVATDVDDLDTSLAELVAGGFLDSVPDAEEHTLVFHHALVQDVAYSRLLRKRRRELHLRVADAAESLYGAGDDSVDLLARHFYLGDAGPLALPYLVRAGERARSLFANDEAILHYTRATELAPDDVEAQLRLGDLLELVGDYDEALRRYGAVRDASHDVRAWQGIASTLRKQGKYIDALATVDEAFSTPALRGQTLTKLWLEGGWTLSVTGRSDQAIDVFLAGLETTGGKRDADVASLLIQLARTESVDGLYEDAVAHAGEAQDIAEETGDLHALSTTLRITGGAYWWLDRLPEARSALERGLELAERVGSAEEIAACLLNLALVAKSAEEFGDAKSYERQAIEEFERAGNATGRAQAYANLADTLERAGELEEALETCHRAQELAREIGYPHAVAATANTLACIELKREHFADAGATAEEAAELYLELGSDPVASEMLTLAAEAWDKAGEAGRARACSARARELVAA